MRIIKRTSALIVVGLYIVAIASADQTKEFKKYMTAMYPKMVKAFRTKDIKFFSDAATPDFTETAMGRTMNRDEALANFGQMFQMVKSIDVKTKPSQLTFKADKGKGTVTGKWVYVGMMKPDAKGKSHKLEATSYTRESWMKKGKDWMIYKMEDTKPGTVKIDGRVVDPSKMGG